MSVEHPAYRRGDSEAEYRDSIVRVIGRARKSIYIFDRDLSRMQLERPPALDALAGFLRGGDPPELRIAVHRPELLETTAPRLRNLLETHGHVASVRCVPDTLRHLADCHLLADASHGIRRFHADHPRCAVAFDNPAEIAPWWLRFEELWEASAPCLSGMRLGL